MGSGKVVASLDIVVRLLADPDWGLKARKVKTLSEMRQILLDFCRVYGQIVQVNEDTYIYL